MRKLILLLSFFCLVSATNSFASNDSFYKGAAGFIYGFSKMIKNRSGPICVYGYDQIVVAMEEKYHDNAVFFRTDNDIASALEKTGCKILYISKSRNRVSNSAINSANKLKVISIGADEDFIDDGGTVYMQMGRRNFELMMNQAKVKAFEVQFDPIVSNLLINN